MDTLIIGFGHRARMGKDLAVATIIDARKEKYDVRRYSFATPLKREVETAAAACGGFPQLLEWLRREIGLPDWVVLDNKPDMTDPDCPSGKHRTLLQWWGTEYRRAQDKNYWVKKMKTLLEQENPQIALLSDMRFLNEFAFVKSFKDRGWTIKVDRVGYVSDFNTEHASEKELADQVFDIDITVADGELKALKDSALEAFDFIVNDGTLRSEDIDFAVKVGG